MINSSQEQRFRKRALESRTDTFLQLLYLIGGVILLIVFWKGCQVVERRAHQKCTIERQLEFKGVVSQCKTDVLAEQSSFILNDSAFITIPRSSKELHFGDGDTIAKIRNENRYIITGLYHFFKKGQLADTVVFQCKHVN